MYTHPKGFLVALEGGEGTGKSTTAQLMYDYLKEQGQDVILVREPGSSPVGQAIRATIMEHRTMELETEIALFIAAKVELLRKTILPALEAGKLVIADRFTGSLFTYQGVMRGYGIGPLIEKLAAFEATLSPNLTVLMMCDQNVSVERLRRRQAAGGEFNSFDTLDLDKHVRLQEAYRTAYRELNSRYPHHAVREFDTTDVEIPEMVPAVTTAVAEALHKHRELYRAVETCLAAKQPTPRAHIRGIIDTSNPAVNGVADHG